MPATLAWHDRVDVPEPPVMVVVDNVHDRFVEFVATVSNTFEVKPFRADTVIVDVPAAAVFTETVAGFAVIVKSGGATATTVTVPEVPVLPL